MRGTWKDVIAMVKEKGIITPADIQELGLAPENLNRMEAQGHLRRVGRGLYEHPDFVPTEHHSYVEVAKSVPSGVVCLVSALSIHGVGTQKPWEVWIAIPRGNRVPVARASRIRVVTLAGPSYDLGVEERVFENVAVKIYSLEKTIVDCFRLRRLVGHDVPVEALREAIRSRRVDVGALLDLAGQLRARNLIQPYVEALT